MGAPHAFARPVRPVLRLAHMAERRRAPLRRCLARELLHVRRGRPYRLGRARAEAGGRDALDERGRRGGLRDPGVEGDRIGIYIHSSAMYSAAMYLGKDLMAASSTPIV